MARSSAQYLDKLAFVVERNRIFDIAGYDDDPETWTRQQKAELTREFNRAQIANATQEYAEQHDYKTMAKLVRPFAKAFSSKEGYRLDDIDNWTPAQKGKLTRYFKKAVDLSSKPIEMYHSTDNESMKAMANLANQKGFPEFNQVFFPAPPGTKLHYDKQTGSAVARGIRTQVTSYYWDQFGVAPDQLAADPYGTALRVLEQLPERKFSIKAGEHSIGKGVPRIFLADSAAKRIRELIEKYDATSFDPNDPNSHYFGNWLDGVDAWEFSDRQAEQDFIRATRGESEERRRYKRALRKRLQYRAKRR